MKDSVDAHLYRARMWREYAMAWDGRPTSTTGVGYKWVKRILKMSRAHCLLNCHREIKAARKANQSKQEHK